MTPPRRPAPSAAGGRPYVSGKSAYRGYFASACAPRQFQIFFFIGLDGGSLCRTDGPHDLAGHADDKAPRRAPACSPAQAPPAAIRQPPPDDRAVQNRGVHPNQAAVAHRAAVHNGPCPTDVPRPPSHPARGRCAARRCPAHWSFPQWQCARCPPAAPRRTRRCCFLKPHAARQCGVFGHKRRAVVGREHGGLL